MTKATARREWIGAAAVGVVAGFLSGLFGVGGGILIVPGLVLLMRMDQRLAHGTSLAAIVPIAFAGVAGYAVKHSVDWSVGAVLIAGAAAGALVGTRALQVVPKTWLAVLFAIFLLLTAIRLFIPAAEAMGRAPLGFGTAAGLVVIGVVAGALAGLLGVGGGIVIVPALVLLFSVPDPVAKGTSLLVIIPTAIVGTVNNLRARNADLRIAMTVGLFGVVAAFAASQVAVLLPSTVS
ncbi:MAG TPA: sulfite exporter TauE/SafE family protein, partial [Actinomycetota bacterium]